MTENIKKVDVSGYTSIDINNVALWVQKEESAKTFEWDKWVGSIVCPLKQSVFTYSVSSSPYYATIITDVFDMKSKESKRILEDTIGLTDNIISDSDVRWLMSMTCFYSKRSDGIDSIAIGRMTIMLDEDGFEMRSKFFSAPNAVQSMGKDHVDEAKYYTKVIITPALVAISLLHCKNIELVDKPVTRAMRRRVKRTGNPLIIQKILEIEPFKRKVINEVTGEKSGLTLAMHICRGHFREYSEEKPMFGKYSGKYWIPQHIKGNKSVGEIDKGYKVNINGDN